MKAATATAPAPSRLPRKVWSYWHDPALPDLLAVCVASWRHHLQQQQYEITVLSADTLAAHVPLTDAERRRLAQVPAATQADYFRARLLLQHGGVWMDASTFLNGPLDFAHAAFDADPAREVLYPVKRRAFGRSWFSWENFFLAAAPGSHFMRAFVDKMHAVLFCGAHYRLFTARECRRLGLDNTYHMAYALHNELACTDPRFRAQCQIQHWDSSSVFIARDHDRALALMQRYYRMYKTGHVDARLCADFPLLFKFWHHQRHRWTAPTDLDPIAPPQPQPQRSLHRKRRRRHHSHWTDLHHQQPRTQQQQQQPKQTHAHSRPYIPPYDPVFSLYLI